jgi:hypothetical protein
MKRIPRSHEIDVAFKALKAEVKAALAELNRAAGRTMARGDYSTAETLAARGKELQGFIVEVDSLRGRWRALRSGPGRGGGGAATPLWAYYQPILKAIASLGGEARRKDLEPVVLNLMGPTLTPSDHAAASGGRERWQVMIIRARKHVIAEGWMESKPGSVWAITEAGQKAAKAAAVGAQTQGR